MYTQVQRTCILHADIKSYSGEIKEFDSKTWHKVVTCDNYRKRQGTPSKYLSIELPSSYGEAIGYHSLCYKNFTAISIQPLDPVVQSKTHCLRSNIDAHTSSTGISNQVCLFCHKATKSQGRHKREQLGNCETDWAGKTIYDAAVKLGDHVMLTQITDMDFIAKAIKYHHSCRRAYIQKAESESTPEQHTSTIMHQNAFVIMKKVPSWEPHWSRGCRIIDITACHLLGKFVWWIFHIPCSITPW